MISEEWFWHYDRIYRTKVGYPWWEQTSLMRQYTSSKFILDSHIKDQLEETRAAALSNDCEAPDARISNKLLSIATLNVL